MKYGIQANKWFASDFLIPSRDAFFSGITELLYYYYDDALPDLLTLHLTLFLLYVNVPYFFLDVVLTVFLVFFIPSLLQQQTPNQDLSSQTFPIFSFNTLTN